MNMSYGMPAREQYRKEEIGKENQLRRPGFKVRVVPLVISAFCKENMFEKDDLCERIVAEMQKTILMDIETIIRKVLTKTRPK